MMKSNKQESGARSILLNRILLEVRSRGSSTRRPKVSSNGDRWHGKPRRGWETRAACRG